MPTLSRSNAHFRVFTLWLTCSTAFPVLFMGNASVDAQSSRSARGAIQKLQALQKAQQQQKIQMLQGQYAAAAKVATQAETEMVAAGTSLQSSESHLKTVEEMLDTQERAFAAALQRQDELESALVAAQPKESTVGRAQAELHQARLKLHEVLHKLLGLPDDEVERDNMAKDMQKLTEAQRTLLKTHPDFLVAQAEVERAQARARETERKLFEGDASWKEADTRRQALVDSLRESKAIVKAAKADVGRSHLQRKRAQEMYQTAHQTLQAVTQQLAMLGARPAVDSR